MVIGVPSAREILTLKAIDCLDWREVEINIHPTFQRLFRRGSCEARLGAKGIYCAWEIENSKELHCDLLDAKLCAQGSK
ncbi:hypothetical protein MKW98_007046 [Papaver atlanticum]|uniref:Uncharacterized protein n=1 Tax=Papaver atlanticum TaxID=357466 RepID=A0AAD4STD3_9MAGN|nr:hypothetical protein MKW98_007046 [Papaver atlanticum]